MDKDLLRRRCTWGLRGASEKILDIIKKIFAVCLAMNCEKLNKTKLDYEVFYRLDIIILDLGEHLKDGTPDGRPNSGAMGYLTQLIK